VTGVAAGRAALALAGLLYLAWLGGLVPGVAAPASVLPLLCIAALMAVSLWLPFASGQLSLAQAGFMAIGAYLSAWLTVHLHWWFLPALGAGARAPAAICRHVG